MVQGVLQAFRRRLDIKEAIGFANVLPPVLRALFRSRHFYAAENRLAVIKSPTQLVVQAVRGLDQTQSTAIWMVTA